MCDKMDVTVSSLDGSSKKVTLEEHSKEELIKKCRTYLALAQKAKQAKDALQEENNQLKQQIKQSAVDEIVQSFTQQKLELVTELEDLRNQCKLLHAKVVSCEEQLADSDNRLSTLDTENQSYKRQVGRLTDENEQLILQLDELEKQINEMKKIGLEQKEQLLIVEKHNLSITENHEHEEEIKELQKMLSVSLEEIKKLKTVNNEMSKQIDEISGTSLSKVTSLSMEDKLELETLQQESKANRQQMEELRTEKLTLLTELEKLKSNLSETAESIQMYQQEIESKNKDIEKHTSIADDLNTELHKNRALIEKLKQDIANTSSKLSDNQIMSSGLTTDLQNTNEKLRDKLKLYHAKMVKFAVDAKKLKETKGYLLDDFKVCNRQVMKWREQLMMVTRRLSEEIVTGEKEKALLRKDIGDKVDELQKAEEEIGKLGDQLKNVQHNDNKEFDEIKQNYKVLEKSYEKKVKELENLEKVLTACENEKSLCNEKINNLMEENAGLSSVRDQLIASETSYDQKIKDYNEEIARTQKENSQIKEVIQKLQSDCEYYKKYELEANNTIETLQKFKSEFEISNEEMNRLTSQLTELQNYCEQQNQEKLVLESSIQKLLAEKESLGKLDNEKIIILTKDKDSMTNQIQGLLKEITELQNRNENLQDSINNCEQNIQELTEKLVTCNESHDQELKIINDRYENEKKIFVEDKEKLELKCLNYAENIKVQNENFAQQKEFNKRLAEELEKFKLANKDHEKLLENTEADDKLITELKATIEHLESEIEHSKQTENKLAEQLMKEITNLTQENRGLLKKIDELEIKIHSDETKSQESSDREIKELEEIVSSIKRENSELLTEMNEMNQALKERGGTINQQQVYCEEILKKISIYETQANKYVETITLNNETIKALQEEVDRLKSQSGSEEVNNLKAEIATLKDRLLNNSVEVSEDTETLSTSTISRADETNRFKELEESWEERYSNLRTLALKLKAKNRDLTAELSKEQSEKNEIQQKISSNLKNLQSLQSQSDKLQDELDSSQSNHKATLKKLDNAIAEINKIKKQLSYSEEVVASLKFELDSLHKDKANVDAWKKQVGLKVQSLKKELEANTVLKKDYEARIQKLNNDLDLKEKTLKSEKEKHMQTKTSLQESTNECKKQSVLNLEMQDYERGIKEITQKLEKKNELVTKLKNQIDGQKSSVNAAKEQNRLLEERQATMEMEINAYRIEVNTFKKNIGELENVISDKDMQLQEVLKTLENVRSENEDLSTQLSQVIAEHQKINIALKEEKDHLRSENLGLEQRVREIDDQFKLRVDELARISSEYDGYKVRAQSVLRQNQSRDVGMEEKLTEEAASFRAQVDILQREVSELKTCVERLSEDNNKLTSERDEKVLKLSESISELSESQKEYEKLSSKYQQTIVEHAETVRCLKVNADTLAQCYRQQIADQEVRHNREIIELQSKIDKSATVLLPELPSLTIPSTPREEGEGSENVDSVNGNNVHPLEKLLDIDQQQDYHELGFVKKQLAENESKVSHLTALLADTEQDLAKHIQMNNLLKEEIRRQQRSVEREKHAENLEYMKNVVFKFITLNSGDERQRLVPVLNTILKLSPDEMQKLNMVAKGDKTWSNYLPLWSSASKP